MKNTNIMRDLYFLKTPYIDNRAPYPWKTAFKIIDPRYKYIQNTYKNEINPGTDFRVIRFISLKYEIAFDYVLNTKTSWAYFKADIIKRLHDNGEKDVIDVKVSYENLRPPISEILLPYVVIADGVFVHLSLIKRKNIGWAY